MSQNNARITGATKISIPVEEMPQPESVEKEIVHAKAVREAELERVASMLRAADKVAFGCLRAFKEMEPFPEEKALSAMGRIHASVHLWMRLSELRKQDA